MTQSILQTGLLAEPNVFKKLDALESTLHNVLSGTAYTIPMHPTRDIQVLTPGLHPPKKGISLAEGQARLLHDLANIELQAMELAIRTLLQYTEAPHPFKEQLGKIALEEGHHLKLCLRGIESLGYQWGDWPIHTALWDCTASEDSLLDRMLIVHCYLEGSGLDASDSILNRLSGVHSPQADKIVRVIAKDEMGHVQFGTRWYTQFCKELGTSPDDDFKIRMAKLAHQLPDRREKINRSLRLKAGFSESQIQTLQDFQNQL
tara:strand:+ start:48061 stop:48843 length:783 start_codon:yes stop_codon:yes gene_type:complete